MSPSLPQDRPSSRPLAWPALLLDHVKPVRVPLLILAVAGTLVLAVDQVRELFLMVIWTDPDAGRYGWLLAGCASTGLAMWYVTRQAYRMIYPRWPAIQDPRARSLREWLPRMLGAAVPASALLGCLVAVRQLPAGLCEALGGCVRRDLRATGLLLETLVLVAGVTLRRPLLNHWCLRRGRGPWLAARPALEPCAAHPRALGRVPCAVLTAALLANVGLAFLIGWRPTLLDGGGLLAILLLAATCMSLSGGLLCMLADRRGWPLLSGLLLIAVALHVLHLNDNHRVRQYPAMNTHQHPAPPPADGRPRMDDYARAWLDTRCAGRANCPVVLVAAEGGGIRAAAWTALVLSRLTERVQALAPVAGEPLLARHLFAASGVSGGSLGLAAYVGLLHAPAGTQPLEQRAQVFLGHDFLAPALANLLFVDFTQRWLPGAWFDDRARALTRAWEEAAREQGITAFAEPFADLYRGADGGMDLATPVLLLNSTTVGQGRRFVQHPFRRQGAPARPAWTAADDGAAWLDPRLPLSEAVLNSARFTYVSPAGTLEAAALHPPAPATLQLVDGGYFENSGASTLLEVMHWLRELAARRGQHLRFIVLHLSNDPQLEDFVDAHDRAHVMPFYSAACPAPIGLPDAGLSGEVSAPVRALLQTREARGSYARTQWLAALHIDAGDPARGDILWHFRLCGGDYPMPLGWTISAPVFEAMRRELDGHYPLEAMARALAGQLAPIAVPP